MCNFLNPDRRWKRLPLAMLLLALAVFGWGLHYKLTLYGQSVQVRASEPAAKLLSERERESRNATDATTESSKPQLEAIVLFAIVAALMPRLSRLAGIYISSQRREAFSALFDESLFMRPPPAAYVPS